MRLASLVLVPLFFAATSSINIGIIPHFENNANIFDAMEILVETSGVLSPLCRNHSMFYIQELKSLRLWATEMFDASTKFDTGALYGSMYDLGNYDQCINIRVPYEGMDFSGRHCLAKFTLEPPKKYRKKDIDFLDDYVTFYNVSFLDKIFSQLDDPAKVARNEFYFSYCIPSSCTHDDLQNMLEHFLTINEVGKLKVNVEVPERSCQLSNEANFDKADIAFISFLGVLFLLIIISSFYDWIQEVRGVQDTFYDRSTPRQILLCFSFVRNLRKLVSVKEDKDGFTCIAGMKSITMTLFIYGHGLMFIISSPIQNPVFIEQMYKRFSAAVLLNGPIVVDTFFILSGFLTSYFMLLELRRRKRGINIFLIYLHRIIRLTPTYLVVLIFYCTIFPKTGNGVLWDQRIAVENERCKASWWANLLYINNYVNKDQICMFQSWYLACDMQLFIIGVLLVLCIWKRPRLTLIFLGCFTLVSVVLVFVTVYLYDEQPILLLYVRFLKDPVLNSTYRNIYIPTHLRFTPYLIGLLAGYIRYKIKKENYIFTKRVIVTGWIACALLMIPTLYAGFVFYSHDIIRDKIFTSLYSSMYHLTWSVSISWMVIAVSCGRGVYVNSVLSWMPNIVLGRLTYSAFLVHGAIQMYLTSSLRTPLHAGYIDIAFYLMGQVFMSFFIGWLLTMCVEAPVMALEKIIFKKQKAKLTESTEKLEEKCPVKNDIYNPKINTLHV